MSAILARLFYPRCVGLSEVGLDYSRSCNCQFSLGMSCSCILPRHEMQKAFLRAVLSLLSAFSSPFCKALVLHCRSHNDEDDSAARDTFSILQELGLTHVAIHLHCFLSSRDEFELWCQTCPNCKFGLTSKFLSRPSHRAVIPRIPEDRLLLESDAPLLSPRAARSSFNTSLLCHHSIRDIASLRGVSSEALVQLCNQNDHNLYRI